MRKRLKIALILLVLAIAVIVGRPVIFLAFVWLNDGTGPNPMPSAGSGDASRMTVNVPAEVIAVAADPAGAERQIVELIKRAATEGRRISIAGAQHSMGGHTFYPGGITLDMKAFNRMSLDEEKRILTVGAGARWGEIIPYLDARGYAISIMQTNNDFSVGGSISVNCHGWQNDEPPIASTVESFRIITPTGETLRCSREQNAELFSLALGGYGLFGVILEVDLRITLNDFYQAEAHSITPADYVETYHKLTKNNPDIGMAYGRLSVAPKSFFEEASITLLRREETDRPTKDTLLNETPSVLKRLVFRGGVNSDYGKNLRWWIEKQVGETGGKLVSRNELMNEPSSLYASRDPDTSDILHEYFIPADQLANFIEKSRPVFLKHHPELLNVTIRNILPDHDTFLRYAPEEMFGLVLLFHQERDEAAEAAMLALTRELIEVALACRGRYYLPYRPHATIEQFHQAYPRAAAFFAKKRHYDPKGIFENKFSQTYGQVLESK
ncbi:FAD-binding oxidoreductase [Akkermansiaceae bacterium]|nr:FAD-binding oxidoreductase [Akkermansiaceae bacterium]MDB4537729.1 FAD-binding oxidoreductase [Akkermansiaceae bacterium]